MRSFRRFVSVGALLTFVALTGGVEGQQSQGTQAPPAPDQPAGDQTPQTPVFRTGINFVRVDVIVTDKNGGDVSDLKQADFEVLEDGKPQTIEAFKLVKLDGGVMPTNEGPPRAIRTDSDEETEAGRDDVRLFAIFLDDYHVREGASIASRGPISRFVDNQLGPSDMIGVMHPLDPIDSVRMTRNHSAVSRAIQQFRGRKGDYTPRNEFEERYFQASAEQVEQIRNQVSLSALKALIIHMGGLKEGRKALILVSEGYSNILPPSLRSPIAALPGFGNPNAGNSGAGQNDPNEERYAFFASQDLEFYMQGVYEVASQNNVAIYPVDPRGLPVFEFDIDQPVNPQTDRQFLGNTQQTLRNLAIETDGRAILNRNDLDVGMKQIMRDSSGYYLIGYSSTQAKSDGKFHAITVRLKRPGLQVRSRKGYWALTPEAASVSAAAARKPAIPAPVEAALTNLAASVQPKSARLVRTWVGTSRGQNGKTKVTLVWEPAPRAAGDRPVAAADQPARMMVMAVAPDGSPFFRGRVPEAVLASAAPPGPGAAGTSAPRGPSRVSFEVNPGKVQLRLSVEGSASQVLDTEVREITVPDLSTPKVAIGTPELFRARTLREFQQLQADANAVPVTGREFSRTDRVLIRVPAYSTGAGTAKVTARLLNRTGQPMNDLSVTPAASVSQIDLPLSGLAAGEYVLEIKASDGDTEATELIGFRVTA
jgi:VWFA-related protein